MKEIEEKWDYPNADNLDWNDAKDDIDKLIQRVKELEAENKDLKFKLRCHTADCIADYEDLEKRIKQLENGIRKYLAGWDKDGPNWNTDVLEKLIE